MAQNYSKVGWKDHVKDGTTGAVLQQGTPVSASKLNQMDAGIDLAHQKLEGANRQTQAITHGLQVLNGDVNAPVSLQMEGRTLISMLNTELDASKYYLLADKRTKLKFSDSLTVQGVAKFQGVNARAQVITRVANFENKVNGSTLENPHLLKSNSTSNVAANSSLLIPSSSYFSEISTAGTASASKQDGTLTTPAVTLNGLMAQTLFGFNVIEEIERTLGKIPRITVADKVAWLKANISRFTCNWFGFGTSATGNKAQLAWWNVPLSAYTKNDNVGYGVHTSGTVAKLSHSVTANANNIINSIDANGFVYFIAWAEASDGTIPSWISTDYVELEIELNAGVMLHAPRVPIYEVTKEHYDAALVTWNEEEVLRRYPMVEGVQHIQNPYVITEGENLLPPFSEWTADSNANPTVISDYVVECTPTSTGNRMFKYFVPVIPGQPYRFSSENQASNNGSIQIWYLDSNKSGQVGSYSYIDSNQPNGFTITPPSGAGFMGIAFYGGTVGSMSRLSKPMLTPGTVTKTFVPRNPSYLFAEAKLGAIGTTKDLMYEADGKMMARKAIEKDIILDSSLGWMTTTNQVFDGYKEFYNKGVVSNVPTTTPAGTGILSKYNGVILKKLISNAITGGIDSFYFTSYNDNAMYVRVSNVDSGFAQSYTPTGDEVKAYFNGWQVKTADASSNKPTAWKSIVDGSDAPTQTLAYVISNKAAGYIPYKLSYALAAPVFLELAKEGAISVSGMTQVEVGSGVVIREKVKPILSGGTYIINSNNLVDNQFKNRTSKILQVYRANVLDSKWSILTSSIANGLYRATIPQADFDSTIDYYATYILYDRNQFTSNVLTATATFANNIRTALDDNIKVTEDNKREISVAALQIYEILKRLKAGGL